jgi:meiotically up-regulated gene 157 (Mug157) protein
MDNLDQKIQQGIQDYMVKKQYDYSKIPSHEHNGTDTVKISQKNIINNNKVTIDFEATPPGGIGTIPNIPNLSRITFMGVLANNASGGTATKRFILNGVAEVGNCYYINGTTEVSTGTNIVAIENNMYVDSTDLTKNRVGAGNGLDAQHTNYLIYAQDNTTTVIGAMTVTYDEKNITLNVSTLATGWLLQGFLILT